MQGGASGPSHDLGSTMQGGASGPCHGSNPHISNTLPCLCPPFPYQAIPHKCYTQPCTNSPNPTCSPASTSSPSCTGLKAAPPTLSCCCCCCCACACACGPLGCLLAAPPSTTSMMAAATHDDFGTGGCDWARAALPPSVCPAARDLRAACFAAVASATASVALTVKELSGQGVTATAPPRGPRSIAGAVEQQGTCKGCKLSSPLSFVIRVNDCCGQAWCCCLSWLASGCFQQILARQTFAQL